MEQNRDIVTGLCLECALCHHQYSEILAHGKGDDHFYNLPLPAARIDGRRHRLFVALNDEETICSECCRKVSALYVPLP